MTSLDLPVVPEVGMRTARSSGITRPSGTAPLLEPFASARRVSRSRTSVAATSPRASSTRGRRAASVTTARGRTWCTSPVSSSSVAPGSVGTLIAPSEAKASQHTTYDGVVRTVTTTSSPWPTPASPSRAASAATCEATSPKVSVSSSVRIHSPSGSLSTAVLSRPGVVSSCSTATARVSPTRARPFNNGSRGGASGTARGQGSAARKGRQFVGFPLWTRGFQVVWVSVVASSVGVMTTSQMPLEHPLLVAARAVGDLLDGVAGADPLYLSAGEKRDLLVELTHSLSRLAGLRAGVLAVADDVAAECGARSAGDWLAGETRTSRRE